MLLIRAIHRSALGIQTAIRSRRVAVQGQSYCSTMLKWCLSRVKKHAALAWNTLPRGAGQQCAAVTLSEAPARSASQRAPGVLAQATFDDELLAEAVAKRHSLTKEAIACGRNAGSYRTILTHFSQVPPPPPPGPPAAYTHPHPSPPLSLPCSPCNTASLILTHAPQHPKLMDAQSHLAE